MSQLTLCNLHWWCFLPSASANVPLTLVVVPIFPKLVLVVTNTIVDVAMVDRHHLLHVTLSFDKLMKAKPCGCTPHN